jgi:hypothetical protein
MIYLSEINRITTIIQICLREFGLHSRRRQGLRNERESAPGARAGGVQMPPFLLFPRFYKVFTSAVSHCPNTNTNTNTITITITTTNTVLSPQVFPGSGRLVIKYAKERIQAMPPGGVRREFFLPASQGCDIIMNTINTITITINTITSINTSNIINIIKVINVINITP